MNPGSDWPMTTRPAQPCTDVLRPATAEPLHCSGQMDLVKYQPPATPPSLDSLLLAYWLMYCRAPRRAEPDVDGSYSIGEIGTDVEKNWSRLTPYSIARKEP
jgi:hypothetical protein